MSMRKAINDKCKDCIYDKHSPGTWREQVAQCSCISCALWPLRPAPSGGPFANPPRAASEVSVEWRKRPIGEAFSDHQKPRMEDVIVQNLE
jgi:hypothetical protein